MRLYLSSYKFGDHTDELVRLAGENKRAGVIMNAVDWGDSERVATSLANQIEALAELGFSAEQLDLRDYFQNQEALRKKVQEYGLVWVHGGNVFVLQRAFQQSGFDVILKESLEKDMLVYAGFSAAVVVLTPTLQGAEIVDDSDIVPQGYESAFDEHGLGLIEYQVAVHYDSDHPESEAIDSYIEFCQTHNLPYQTLRDGEVIIIDGDETKILPRE